MNYEELINKYKIDPGIIPTIRHRKFSKKLMLKYQRGCQKAVDEIVSLGEKLTKKDCARVKTILTEIIYNDSGHRNMYYLEQAKTSSI